MKSVEIYTDGACKGNPGKGGWGVIIQYQDKSKELFGGREETTNNQMEMQAVIEGLGALKEPCSVTLYTDSKYVMDGITNWIHGWKKNNWKTANKKPVKNMEYWQALDELTSHHEISWKWVKGHAGIPGNERADALANLGIESL
ncbi:MAG: ribonuclease HI [Gammaproteobacteria bacterium]